MGIFINKSHILDLSGPSPVAEELGLDANVEASPTVRYAQDQAYQDPVSQELGSFGWKHF